MFFAKKFRYLFLLFSFVTAFFAGYLLSRASSPDKSADKVTPQTPVNINSSQLIFDKLRGLTLFKGKVKALHGTVVLTADEIRAFSENNAATASGHVKVVDKSQGVTLTCGNLEYQDLMETMTAHDHPILTSVDGAGKPVTILGRQMELDSAKKTVVVNQNVEIDQANSDAEAQKATFFANENKLVLEDDPKVYTSNAQISARRITTTMGEGKSFFAEGMADALFNPNGAPLTVKKKATPTGTPGPKKTNGAQAEGTGERGPGMTPAGQPTVTGTPAPAPTAAPTEAYTPVPVPIQGSGTGPGPHGALPVYMPPGK